MDEGKVVGSLFFASFDIVVLGAFIEVLLERLEPGEREVVSALVQSRLAAHVAFETTRATPDVEPRSNLVNFPHVGRPARELLGQ
jgi:hypothetical protein